MTTDPHADAMAYALNALDTNERQAFETHLAGCAQCRDDVARYGDDVLALVEDERTPAPELRHRLLTRIAAEPQQPAHSAHPAITDADVGTTGVTARNRSTSTRTRLASGTRFALLAAAVLIIAAVFVWRPWSSGDDDRYVADTQAVMDAADAQTFSMTLGDEAAMSVTRSAEMGKAVLVIEGMDPPQGYEYQAWYMIDGDSVDAGVMPAPDDGMSQMVLEGDPMHAAAVAITVEPEGGSSAPGDDKVATISLS